MDPIETLKQLRASVESNSYAFGVECMMMYATWRFKGGFEPPGGDALFEELANQLHDCIDAKQRADEEAERLAYEGMYSDALKSE